MTKTLETWDVPLEVRAQHPEVAADLWENLYLDADVSSRIMRVRDARNHIEYARFTRAQMLDAGFDAFGLVLSGLKRASSVHRRMYPRMVRRG